MDLYNRDIERSAHPGYSRLIINERQDYNLPTYGCRLGTNDNSYYRNLGYCMSCHLWKELNSSAANLYQSTNTSSMTRLAGSSTHSLPSSTPSLPLRHPFSIRALIEEDSGSSYDGLSSPMSCTSQELRNLTALSAPLANSTPNPPPTTPPLIHTETGSKTLNLERQDFSYNEYTEEQRRVELWVGGKKFFDKNVQDELYCMTVFTPEGIHLYTNDTQ